MAKNIRYYDIEQDEFITESELMKSYTELKDAGHTEATNFEEYLENCMVWNNGSLELNERTQALDMLDDEGNRVYNDEGNYVERVNMCGGKYLLLDANNEVSGLTDSIDKVFEWLEV